MLVNLAHGNRLITVRTEHLLLLQADRHNLFLVALLLRAPLRLTHVIVHITSQIRLHLGDITILIRSP